MSDKFNHIKTMLTATLARLNTHGVIASVFDAAIALAKAREAKVAESLRGIFGTLTLEELAVAREVVDSFLPKRFVPAEATLTQPPATNLGKKPAPVIKPGKGKR